MTTESDEQRWIRKRPGMYVGDTHEGRGVLNLVLELVANAVDQVFVARCTHLEVRVDDDDSVTVSDDGPGIPVEGTGRRPSLVEILEHRFDLPTVDGHRPHVHLGLGAIGLAVVNALSDPFELVTVRDGQMATARYRCGLAEGPLRVEPTTLPSGTRVRFRPDPQIFTGIQVPWDDLGRRMMDLSYLLPQVRLSWPGHDVQHAGGLRDLVTASGGGLLGGVAHHCEEYEIDGKPVAVEVALAWREDAGVEPVIHSFVNLGRTYEGTHVHGLLKAARRAAPRVGGTRGLVAAVAVVLVDVTWGSPIRDRMTSPEARPAVRRATEAALAAWAAAWPEAAAAVAARGEA
ncbi:ATP-binding protein [Nannocystis radixulma]|uniref:DNA topoisomerase (ATP-hydrolyzing) n=1 Tax=Nannocystis radixulma TaxID=2995305 RepID=A0ABT5B7M7_9BACT|nr:ATP-binding protein [Nannocystis radixulma]MDC0670123.1 ATP-binding protein [Nannocystis radixulma]